MGLETLFRLSVIMRLSDLVSGPMRGVRVSANETTRSLQQLQERSDALISSGTKIAATGAAMATAMMLPVKSTFATGAALGEVASLGVKDLTALTKAATKFSNDWAGTSKAQFISAAYDIKSGISSLSDTGVAEYTRLAALTGKATKATTADMTSLFATGHGIYKSMYGKMSDEVFGKMFSGGIAAAVMQFKTTGPQMSEAISGLGASATVAKRPLEEQLSILGMLQATMSGGEAGTKYAAFIQSAAKAGKGLGLSFTDSNNQLLSMADIIGKLRNKYGTTIDAMEKQQIAEAFGTDEAVDLIDLMYPKLDLLKSNVVTLQQAMRGGTKVTEEMARAMNIDPGSKWQIFTQRVENLKEAVGESLLPTFIPTIDKLTTLTEKTASWAEAHPKLSNGIAMTTAALGALLTVVGLTGAASGILGNGFATLGKGVVFLKNTYRSLPGTFDTIRLRGMYAMDGIRSVAGTARSATVRLATSTADLARSAGTAATGGIKSLASGAANVARQTALAAAGGIRSVTIWMANMARQATLAALGGVRILAMYIANLARQGALATVGGLRSFTLGLVQLARQGIAAAARVLPGLIASVWSFTVALLANPITWIVIGVVALIAALILLWQNWDTVTAAFSTGWTWLKTIFGQGKQWVVESLTSISTWISSKFTEYRTSGAALIQAFVEGIKSFIDKPYEVVKSGLAKLRNLLPFSDAKEGPLSQLTRSGRAVVETMAGGMLSRGSFLKNSLSGIMSGMDLNPCLTGQVALNTIVQPQPAFKLPIMPELPTMSPMLNYPEFPSFPDLPNLPGFPSLPTLPSYEVPSTQFHQSGVALMQSFANGIKSNVTKPYEVMKSGLTKLRKLLQNGLDLNSALTSKVALNTVVQPQPAFKLPVMPELPTMSTMPDYPEFPSFPDFPSFSGFPSLPTLPSYEVPSTQFHQSGATLMQSFADGIKSNVTKPYEVMKGGLTKLRKLLQNGLDINSALTSKVALSTVVQPQPALPDLTDYEAPNMFRAAPVGSQERNTFNIREIFREINKTSTKETVRSERRSGPLANLNYYGNDRNEADSLIRDLESFLERRKV